MILINLFNYAYITFLILFIVTVARAIELKHNSSLITALANETSKLFLDAANTLRPFKPEISAQWIKYLELKAAFYQSYVSLKICKKVYNYFMILNANKKICNLLLVIRNIYS